MEPKKVATFVVIGLLVIVLVILIVMGYNNIVARNRSAKYRSKAKTWWTPFSTNWGSDKSKWLAAHPPPPPPVDTTTDDTPDLS